MDVPDAEGQDLPDLAAAKDFAVHQVRALIAATVVDEGRIVFHHHIDIEDDQHDVIGTVSFKDVVKIEE